MVTSTEHFTSPKTYWDFGTTEEEFDAFIQIIAGVDNTNDIFTYYDILYNTSSLRLPRFVTSRLAGSYGSSIEKTTEIFSMSRYAIVKKHESEIDGYESLAYSGFPSCIDHNTIISNLPDGVTVSKMISSLENCIKRRNTLRNDYGISSYKVLRGHLVYDELVFILQILRAKLILSV